MAGNPSGDMPARQDVSLSRDGFVAGRKLDVHHHLQVPVSESYGVQADEHSTQVNNYFIGQGVGLLPAAVSAGLRRGGLK
jgi:hypothetical protein